MFVSDAPAGASFRVKRVLIEKEVGKRLADMGFTEGAEGAVVRSGFLHGPMQVRIRGYDIMIRRSEAAGIEVEAIGDWSAARDSQRRHGGRGGRFGPGCHGPGSGCPGHGPGPGGRGGDWQEGHPRHGPAGRSGSFSGMGPNRSDMGGDQGNDGDEPR